ncbi:MAG: zinc ribbon domain-containing protein [Bacteroidales bacterium]|jgi:hypothetical protein|nr:zinc ribbon domain-containing protein [Bacteroidales bacterium]
MNEHVCQSCGMPMKTEEDFGTNADLSINEDYCHYCFKDGNFTHDLTMDEVIELNLQYLNEFNKDSPKEFTVEEARGVMKEYFPTLKRWNNYSKS